ncbi:MAG: type II toxin-antitoxin system VapC family toxin [Burkholderiaceae bacterium]
MKYLLDTCFLSELVKPVPEQAVLSWMGERVESELFVSALTIAEIGRGIERLAASRRQTELSAWLQQLKVGFENRILAFTVETASAWAHMCANVEAKGKPMATFDSIIAATALEHSLALVTRNVRDFTQAPVVLINPWPAN